MAGDSIRFIKPFVTKFRYTSYVVVKFILVRLHSFGKVVRHFPKVSVVDLLAHVSYNHVLPLILPHQMPNCTPTSKHLIDPPNNSESKPANCFKKAENTTNPPEQYRCGHIYAPMVSRENPKQRA